MVIEIRSRLRMQSLTAEIEHGSTRIGRIGTDADNMKPALARTGGFLPVFE